MIGAGKLKNLGHLIHRVLASTPPLPTTDIRDFAAEFKSP
jgi:hypothetical protein